MNFSIQDNRVNKFIENFSSIDDKCKSHDLDNDLYCSVDGSMYPINECKKFKDSFDFDDKKCQNLKKAGLDNTVNEITKIDKDFEIIKLKKIINEKDKKISELTNKLNKSASSSDSVAASSSDSVAASSSDSVADTIKSNKNKNLELINSFSS